MKIRIYKTDDWEVLYIDNQKISEGHGVHAEEVFREVEKRFPEIDFYEEWDDGSVGGEDCVYPDQLPQDTP